MSGKNKPHPQDLRLKSWVCYFFCVGELLIPAVRRAGLDMRQTVQTVRYYKARAYTRDLIKVRME